MAEEKKSTKPVAAPQQLDAKAKQQAEASLYAGLYDRGDGKTMMWTSIGAIVFHAVVIIFLSFPSVKAKPKEESDKPVMIVRKYVPPPPKIERKVVERKEIKKKAPLPDPTPDDPEPIREPEPEIEDDPIPPDFDIVIGDPTPPPVVDTGPLIPGVDGVTQPVKLEEFAVQPTFPELARRARVNAKVILQAVIKKDGAVGDLEVLQCNRPNMGFEDAAMEAVQQWRYTPAMQGDRPVEVYLTVFVDFALN